jgi:chitinase
MDRAIADLQKNYKTAQVHFFVSAFSHLLDLKSFCPVQYEAALADKYSKYLEDFLIALLENFPKASRPKMTLIYK